MSASSHPQLHRQLEELNLLTCSLMPGESLQFTPGSLWERLLETYADAPDQSLDEAPDAARFQLRVDDAKLWFDMELPLSYPSDDGSVMPSVFVRGDEISRSEHERWQAIVKDLLDEVRDSEYPLYELTSGHLLPFLHEEVQLAAQAQPAELEAQPSPTSGERYHALLTSHHLISPTKRRNMQNWSTQLNVSGFAKVGYPGIIYCEGFHDQVEQFVANIKAMQWLALRVRFVEPMPKDAVPIAEEGGRRHWAELEKVGDVVEEMRKLGRDNYVVEMGIGSAGTK
ncbi:hypothetical protein PsYK624_157670 [Phanerochaete sordida]|uniref:Small nuclear ribonucleoprotein Prp3 C-terminal domain-containing protein n=1 Tax=Phanerochaete sordida TaxID=48140 RepID=A0A9P3GR20_9APHY|nr:hypothetical protein PsYK624_157670 [Phanerochaete sordida]